MKVYQAQKLAPVKGDWVTIVKEDLNMVKIGLNEHGQKTSQRSHIQ